MRSPPLSRKIRALTDAGLDLAPDMALGHGVVIEGDPDMATRADLAFDPLAPFPGDPGQGLEPLRSFEQAGSGRMP
ncbi:MAG: hypothetical protein OXF51_09055 [Alphaproteobacteria bacterium]|nr:hypothetical protein [Alphaproteobacteria bacterium]